jgi:hypothetical protein
MAAIGLPTPHASAMPRPLALSLDEIALAFRDEATAAQFPPLLTVLQFARLFQVSERTAKHWLGSGDFAGATTRVGKHRRVWRDRAVQIAFARARTKPRPGREPLPSSDTQKDSKS